MTLLPRNNNLTEIPPQKPEGNQLFPVFLKLNNLHTVLIGGGNVGLEKLTAMLQNSPGAAITVISKTFLPQIEALAAGTPKLTIIQKAFVDTDLDGADLVIAATDDAELNSVYPPVGT
jgi:siroheme synthase-like protein